MESMSRQWVCVLMCLVWLVPATASAQGGAVSGRIVDPQGAAVSGADVVLARATGTRSTAAAT
jgi:hypothetical protein